MNSKDEILNIIHKNVAMKIIVHDLNTAAKDSGGVFPALDIYQFCLRFERLVKSKPGFPP